MAGEWTDIFKEAPKDDTQDKPVAGLPTIDLTKPKAKPSFVPKTLVQQLNEVYGKPKGEGAVVKPQDTNVALQKHAQDYLSEMYGGQPSNVVSQMEGQLGAGEPDMGTAPPNDGSTAPTPQDQPQQPPEGLPATTPAPAPSGTQDAPVAAQQAAGSAQVVPQKGMVAIKSKAGTKVTEGHDLPELSGNLSSIQAGIKNLSTLQDQAAEESDARTAENNAKLAAADAAAQDRQRNFQASQDAKYNKASAEVSARVEELQKWQPTSFFERSPGRAVLAILGSGLAAGAGNMSVFNQVATLIKDDTRMQWEGKIQGVKSAERQLYDTMKASGDEWEFMKSVEASKWATLNRELDRIAKRPLPAEQKIKIQEWQLNIQEKLNNDYSDLSKARMGKVEHWRAVVESAKMSGGTPGTSDPLMSITDPRDRRASEQKLWQRSKFLVANNIPALAGNVNQVAQDLQRPDIARHIGVINTMLSRMGNPSANHPYSDAAFIQILNHQDPEAARVYQDMQSLMNHVTRAMAGLNQTESEGARLMRSALMAGDIEGIRHGMAAIQRDFDSIRMTIDVGLNPTELQSAYWREAKYSQQPGTAGSMLKPVDAPHAPPTTLPSGANSGDSSLEGLFKKR
jgi:hypothetical protein